MGSLNCKITKGFEGACQTNVSGVLRMAITNWDESYDFHNSEANGCIDSIDLGEEKAYNLDILDGTGNATSTGSIGGSGDSKYHQHAVSGTIARLDCSTANGAEYNNWFLGRVIIFVETKNREVFAFGVDNGLTSEQFTFDTGTAEGDSNGISFVFSGAQPNAPLKISDWSLVKALID